MKLKAKVPFSWAHQGVRVEHFEAGQVIETDDEDLIEVSQREGWTVRPRTGKDTAPPPDQPGDQSHADPAEPTDSDA